MILQGPEFPRTITDPKCPSWIVYGGSCELCDTEGDCYRVTHEGEKFNLCMQCLDDLGYYIEIRIGPMLKITPHPKLARK